MNWDVIWPAYAIYMTGKNFLQVPDVRTTVTYDIVRQTYDAVFNIIVSTISYVRWYIRHSTSANRVTNSWTEASSGERPRAFRVIRKKNLGAKHCKVYLLTASLHYLLFSDSNASHPSGTCRKFLPVIYLSYACDMTSQFIYLSYIKYMTLIYFPTKLTLFSYRMDI